MDKNKSAFKLDGLPHVYWINLDRATERRHFMEHQLQYWGIENHTRISAYDGGDEATEDVTSMLKGKFPPMMNTPELACCMSHLNAIRTFYEETDDEYCIIAEDDVNIDIARYWSFTWKEFFSLLPHDWDCVQMTSICTGDIHIKLHLKFINDFSAAFYMISRHHAAKLMRHHIRGNKYKLDQGIKTRAVSEDTILESGKTYTMPIMLYNMAFASDIHQEHINVFHEGPHTALLDWWKNHGINMDLATYMDWDPYLTRVSEKSKPEAPKIPPQPRFNTPDGQPVDAQGNVHLNPDFRPDKDVEYGDGLRKRNI